MPQSHHFSFSKVITPSFGRERNGGRTCYCFSASGLASCYRKRRCRNVMRTAQTMRRSSRIYLYYTALAEVRRVPQNARIPQVLAY
jgi:hypothetical protein